MSLLMFFSLLLNYDVAIWNGVHEIRLCAFVSGISEIRSFRGTVSVGIWFVLDRYGVRCDARRERVMDIRYMNDVQFHGTIVT